ncbi:MAG: hypothetical protein U0931_11010 [Vulcanimicrobiota bacterium]
MQITSNFKAAVPQARSGQERPAGNSPETSQDGYKPGSEGDDFQPYGPNYAQTGALYGGLAGSGIAVALGCMTFGVGLMAGIATVPLGIALGTGIGAVADLLHNA